MKKKEVKYTKEPAETDKQQFTDNLNAAYSKYARLYDVSLKLILPFWRRWLKRTIPHLEGKRVLEASFGTGYLLLQFAADYDAYGIDYNANMLTIAGENLEKKKLKANLQQANVEQLPFEDGFFDSLVNTMAFSGYPDGVQAMSEFHRVLKPGGKLIIVDYDYPSDGNRIGCFLTRVMEKGGDVIRDMEPLFKKFNFEFTREEIGGFGSVHLFVARKKQ